MISKYIAIIGVLLTGCSSAGGEKKSSAAKPTEFTATLTTVSEIRENAEIEDSWLVRPGQIAIDKSDNIYVTDVERSFIQKFDADGNFIRKIGADGKGPGEFTQLMNLFVDDEIIGHARGHQVMNVFDLNGEFKNSYPIQGLSNRTEIFRNGSTFLLFNNNFSRSIEDFYGLHTYNSNFEKIGESQLHMSEIYEDFNMDLANQMWGKVGNAIMLGKDRFALAPKLYPGKLFEYELDAGTELWQQKRVIPTTMISKLYTKLSSRDGADMIIFFGDEEYSYRQHTESLNFFRLNDGRFIHFVKRDTDSERQYGIELFDEDLNYLGYSVLLSDTTPLDDEREYLQIPQAKDSRDLFYSIETGDGDTFIAAKKLNIEVKE